ncbi:MAG: tetratricopeptide repeat protein, partial [Chloroflexi bacterium]|nr:tetratricopeptide repeat protein [Chloroflexota bacterium]
MRAAGQWADLAKHLSAASQNDLTPELVVIWAYSAIMVGNPHRAVELVDQALVSPEDVPPALRAHALLVRAAASRLRGFPQKALEDASAATAILESQTSPPDLLVQGHKQIGLALATTGELDGAIDHFERALRLCARSSDLSLQAEIQNALGLTSFRLGRLPEAQVHYKNAAAAYKKLERRAELSDLYINMGWLHFNLGEHALALELYERALELARAAQYHRSVSMALVNIGDVHLALGQHDRALGSYEEALQSGADALEPRLFCCANTGLGSVYRALKDPRRSRFYLEQAVYEARKLNLRHEMATASLVEGELCLDEGNHERAKGCLESCVTIFQEIGALRPLVHAYLLLGQVYLRSKRWKFLNETLQALATVVQQLDSSDQLFHEAANARDVIDYAASKRIGGSLFSSVRARLRGLTDAQTQRPLSRPRAEADISGETLPKVEVFALGNLQILVDGRKVSTVEWESLKAQELFAYLICNRQGKSREELIEVLWPEISVSLSRNAFHNNMYRTRRALYKGCVVLEEGRYLLQPQGTFWF